MGGSPQLTLGPRRFGISTVARLPRSTDYPGVPGALLRRHVRLAGLYPPNNATSAPSLRDGFQRAMSVLGGRWGTGRPHSLMSGRTTIPS